MKGKILAEAIEKTIAEIQLQILGSVKEYTPKFTVENYLIVKKISEKNNVNYVHILKIIGHCDYDVETKVNEYESRLRMHKHDSE
jgi:hypothetical protein